VKERDALYTELHSLGTTFRAKHDKLQEQVRQRGDDAAAVLAGRSAKHMMCEPAAMSVMPELLEM
jgi:hypothetical protein